MAIAGRVAIVPKGDWSANATYKRLDAVTYNNTLYFAKKDVPAGTVTSNTEYWSKSIVGGAGAIATTDDAGIVKPDGTTITVDADGTIHGKSEIKVDGTTITLDEAKGIISLAKTLQEKIGTIDDKLPAANVANNQVTTEAGFALDARQANPNIDGSLAKQLSDLNGSLNDKFSQQYLVSNLSDVKDIGIYYIHNSSEMPSTTGWYVILSFARQDGSTIPMIAMDQFSDNVYYGRLYKGNNGYQLTSWNKL